MNKKICIGKSDGKNVYIDLLKLWKTRLLIMANSGGGKSWLLRLLAELICKIMPVIIIDPEGEFVTLREKFPFVLVGKGGETTADLRTAKLVMTKILELRASAIFDLSEMPLRERHEYVKLISEAAIGAPKHLWRMTCFIFDEVHEFCPENGKGESVAKKAVLAFPTQGRKRQFICIFATQRPNKLALDARAELLNRMIGMTFEPDDLKVAASTLGISGKTDVPAFNHQMRTMEEGNFFAFGRAISLETILVKVGMVQTSHGVDGSMPQAVKAPPTPDKVKALLPQLADLPKEAENAANVEASLRAEIAELRRQLRERPAVAAPVTERVEVPVLSDKQIQDLRKILEPYQLLIAQQIGKTEQVYAALNNTFEAVMKTRQNGHAHKPYSSTFSGPPGNQVRVERPLPRAPVKESDSEGQLTGPEQRIVDAIAWLNSIGIQSPRKPAVAFLAGYTYGGGGFNNPCGRLRTLGHVEYLADNRMSLTHSGIILAQAPEAPLTAEELQSRVLSIVDGPMQRILKPLLEAYPNSLSKEELAGLSGYAFGSGGFNNPLGRLRTVELVEYPERNFAKASPLLFLEQ